MEVPPHITTEKLDNSKAEVEINIGPRDKSVLWHTEDTRNSLEGDARLLEGEYSGIPVKGAKGHREVLWLYYSFAYLFFSEARGVLVHIAARLQGRGSAGKLTRCIRGAAMLGRAIQYLSTPQMIQLPQPLTSTLLSSPDPAL